MARLPYAAEVLLDEVTGLYPKAEMEPVGEADGLGVHRTVRFDKATSSKIAGAVEWLEDPRVHSVKSEHGRLEVTFEGTSPLADSRDEFYLAEAVDALAGGDEVSET